MLNLTKQERQVILFLIIVALVGTGINFLAKRYSAVEAVACFDQNIAKIDLNKADREMLVSITGIGEKLAQRILEYRNQNGDFTGVEELKKIKGITDYRYEKLKDLLFVR